LDVKVELPLLSVKVVPPAVAVNVPIEVPASEPVAVLVPSSSSEMPVLGNGEVDTAVFC
jgi:hypothetical protein